MVYLLYGGVPKMGDTTDTTSYDPFVDGIVDEKTSTNREPPHLWKHPYREKKHIMKRRLSACFEYAGDFKIVYDAVGNGFGTTFNTGSRRTVQRFQC